MHDWYKKQPTWNDAVWICRNCGETHLPNPKPTPDCLVLVVLALPSGGFDTLKCTCDEAIAARVVNS